MQMRTQIGVLLAGLLTFMSVASANERISPKSRDRGRDFVGLMQPGHLDSRPLDLLKDQPEKLNLITLAQVQGNPAGQSIPATEPKKQFQYIHGRLSYRKKTGSGFERGREDWWLTRNRDGSRTMRTLAMTDDSEFVRDVIYTLGADERPQLVLIQLQVGEKLIGSGYFRVSGDTMNIVTDGIDTGHTVQVVHVPPRFHVLTHAVMLDGWPAWAFEGSQNGSQTIAVYTTSPLWNGTSGPLGRMTEQRFTLLGSEQITVPAGTFQTRHFRFGDEVDPERASHVWVTGENNILVKYDWPPYGMEYLLESLTIETQMK